MTALSSNRREHMQVRYFFIQDKIEQGKRELMHCPIEQLWAEVLT